MDKFFNVKYIREDKEFRYNEFTGSYRVTSNMINDHIKYFNTASEAFKYGESRGANDAYSGDEKHKEDLLKQDDINRELINVLSGLRNKKIGIEGGVGDDRYENKRDFIKKLGIENGLNVGIEQGEDNKMKYSLRSFRGDYKICDIDKELYDYCIKENGALIVDSASKEIIGGTKTFSPFITDELIEYAKRDGMKEIDNFKNYFIGAYQSDKDEGRSYYGYEYNYEKMSSYFNKWLSNVKNIEKLGLKLSNPLKEDVLGSNKEVKKPVKKSKSRGR